MKNATSFLDSLLGGLGGAGGVQGLAGKARTAWDGQSTLTKGAIAGGLLGVLLSGNARRLVGTGVKVGGAALIGGQGRVRTRRPRDAAGAAGFGFPAR